MEDWKGLGKEKSLEYWLCKLACRRQIKSVYFKNQFHFYNRKKIPIPSKKDLNLTLSQAAQLSFPWFCEHVKSWRCILKLFLIHKNNVST